MDSDVSRRYNNVSVLSFIFFSRSIENVKVSNKYIVFLDKLFGTHFQITPTIQSTSNPSITSKTTDRTSTSDAHALSHATSNKY